MQRTGGLCGAWLGALVALVALGSAMGCAHLPALPSLPPASAHPDAPATTLLDSLSVRYAPDPSSGRAVSLATVRSVTGILRAGGESAARIRVPFHPVYRQLVDFRARTVGPDGRQRTYRRRDAADVPAYSGFVLYTDSRSLVLDVQPAVPGTRIEVEYTLRCPELLLCRERQVFGNSTPTAEVRLEVVAPEAWRVEWKAMRMQRPLEFQPARRVEKGQRWLTWERHNVPAPPAEPLVPGGAEPFEAVEVRLEAWSEAGQPRAGFRDAAAMSAWLAARSAERAVVTPEVRELAASLVGDADSDEQRARRLFAWVRDRVAYCAIEIGWGGFIPHAADDVARLGYGDCKDKANLLSVLLAAVGVPSRPAEIYHHEGLPRPFSMATVAGNFNHVILMVELPGGPRFVDPTGRTASFDRLPRGDQDADVLPIAAEGAGLLHTPLAPVDDSRMAIRAELRLSAAGQLEGPFTIESSGELAANLRAALLSRPGGLQDPLVADWLDVRGARVLDLHSQAVEPGELERPVVVSGTLRAEGGAERAPDTLVLRPRWLLDPWLPTLPAGPRTLPALLPWRQVRTQSVRLALPEQAAPSRLPEDAAVSSRFGDYRLSWRHEGGALLLSRSLRIEQSLVEPADYPALLRWLQAVSAADAEPAVVRLGATARQP